MNSPLADTDQLHFVSSNGTTIILTDHEPKWLDHVSDRDLALIEALCNLVITRLYPKQRED